MTGPYPVVDLFAGPGGLGEGFASIEGEKGKRRFDNVVAIERDACSHQTLLLRHFFRQFADDSIPKDYYDYLSGKIVLADLYKSHPAEYLSARKRALQISLGSRSESDVRSLITARLAGRAKWVLVGGPPCQAYSLAGRSRMMGTPGFAQDERHLLYREYLRIILNHAPPVFVMENVKGLLSATLEGESTINRIIADLTCPSRAFSSTRNQLRYRLYSLSEAEQAGREVDPRLFLVRAEKYGVPQARHRMFIVGIRSDIKAKPSQLRAHEPPTVRQTIGGLPQIRSRLSRGLDSPEAWKQSIMMLNSIDLRSGLNGLPKAKEFVTQIRLRTRLAAEHNPTSSSLYRSEVRGTHRLLHYLRDPALPLLTDHDSRGHMASDLRRYMFATVFAEITGNSPKLIDFPEQLLPNHKNAESGRAGSMFSDRFRVQLPEQVATTVTSHISKDGHYFIHYDPAQCRSLTVREAARLQTFPDNYQFEGPRTAKFHQIGNAVPPYLAAQIAEIIADVLDAMNGSP